MGGDMELKQRGKKEETKDMEVDAEVVYEDDKKDENVSMDDKLKKTTYADVICEGLVWIDAPDTGRGENWKAGKMVAAFAVFMSVSNSMIVFFSPCFIDVASAVCWCIIQIQSQSRI